MHLKSNLLFALWREFEFVCRPLTKSWVATLWGVRIARECANLAVIDAIKQFGGRSAQGLKLPCTAAPGSTHTLSSPHQPRRRAIHLRCTASQQRSFHADYSRAHCIDLRAQKETRSLIIYKRAEKREICVICIRGRMTPRGLRTKVQI